MLRLLRGSVARTRWARALLDAFRGVRNFAIGVVIQLWPSRSVPGLLSVVVPVYDVEAYVGACLRSLRRQKHPWVQIVVVDDGSPDDSISVIRRHRRRDPRITVVRQKNQGLSAARNSGVQHAKGEYLTFVDSDDTVAPGSYRTVVGNLRQSGSDFAVMGYQRKRGRRVFSAAEWIRAVHSEPQLRATLEQRPDVQVNAVAWSKIYRAEFYHRAELKFPVGVLYEDQPVSAAAYAKATAFDISSEVAVNWRIREDETSISQQGHDVSNMVAQMDAGFDALTILRREGHEDARAIRALQILSINLGFYINEVAQGDVAYFNAFRAQVQRFWEIIGDERIEREVPIRRRIFYRLVRDGDRAQAVGFLRSRIASFNHHNVIDAGGSYLLDVPEGERDRFALTPADLQLHEADLGFIGGIRRIWFEGGRLWIQGWAYIAGIAGDVDNHSLELWFDWRDQRLPLEVQFIRDLDIDSFSGHRYVDYTQSGFRASMPVADIPKHVRGAVLRGRLTAGGETREGAFYRRGQAEGGRTAIATLGTGRFAYTSAIGGRPLTLTTDSGVRAGRLDVFKMQASATLLSQTVSDDGITMRMRLRVRGQSTFLLQGSKVSVPGQVVARAGTEVTVRFPLRAQQWGQPDVPIPSGSYFVRVGPLRKGFRADIWLDEDLARNAPLDAMCSTHRVNLRQRHDGERPYPAWEIGAPVPPKDRGGRNQQRLIDGLVDTTPSEKAFFVRSLYGEVANCNPKGLQEEINRQGIDLPVYWSVTDYSVVVPDGGIPVLQATEEWHQRIRASQYLMVNVHQHPWYRKAEGQTIIETFHGYPYKQMGHAWWRARDFDAAQVEDFDRRARDWDYVISPASYATDLLSEAFVRPAASAASMLPIGYPRNDVLFRAGEMQRMRDHVRQALDIAADKKVILYAPTFRDYLSVDDMTADNVDFLKPAELLDALGEEYVLLMRGHPFNARSDRQSRRNAKVVDVTSYPDINDLIAASDAAVLDYSSLRFDYALTGKPMVFFVPDLEKYHSLRPGLVDYADTAPGPLVDTQEQLIEELADLSNLTARWRKARQEFRRGFADLDDGHAAARLLGVLGLTEKSSSKE